MSDSVQSYGLQPARLFTAMGFSRKRVLEWVAMLSSTGSSQPRDQTSLHLPALAGRLKSTIIRAPSKFI